MSATIIPMTETIQTDHATNPAMMVDLYELTMLDAALKTGVAHRRACFEAFARRLPLNRSYGVVAGIGRLSDMVSDFGFEPEDIDYLESLGRLSDDVLGYLETFIFQGDIWSYREGDLYFPFSPVVRVDATFGEALLLETLILSVLNHDCAIASASSRMRTAAKDRTLIEMGGRRTHEHAAIAAARAAYLTGFDATSNVQAGAMYDIPVAGTSAHAFTLVYHDELEAFKSQIATQGLSTTLLIDTFDMETGTKRAIEAAGCFGGTPGAVRIDSGDLTVEIPRVRGWLDEAGAEDTKIVVSGDLNEYSLEVLADCQADGYGVGTELVTGSGFPTASMVYKVVAAASGSDPDGDLVPVEKKSAGKQTRGGLVRPYRVFDNGGTAISESLVPDGQDPPPISRALHVPLHVSSEPESTYPYSLSEDREFHKTALDELPPAARELSDVRPALLPA